MLWIVSVSIKVVASTFFFFALSKLSSFFFFLLSRLFRLHNSSTPVVKQHIFIPC